MEEPRTGSGSDRLADEGGASSSTGAASTPERGASSSKGAASDSDRAASTSKGAASDSEGAAYTSKRAVSTSEGALSSSKFAHAPPAGGESGGSDQPDSEPRRVPPYTILAAGYDFVMSHVDYAYWAEYIHKLLRRHRPEAQTILELGCGTGSLATTLQPRGDYRYLATDISAEMIDVGRHKAKEEGADVRFERADFTDFTVDRPVDVILLLYDGLNYLLEKEKIQALMRCAFEALADEGIFIVDQSTPSNSIRNEAFFEHSDRLGIFSYHRQSRYDEASRLHTTILDMKVEDQHFREEHVQRAYEMTEIEKLAAEAGFRIEASYDGFSTSPGTDESERIHWVLRRPPRKSAT